MKVIMQDEGVCNEWVRIGSIVVFTVLMKLWNRSR